MLRSSTTRALGTGRRLVLLLMLVLAAALRGADGQNYELRAAWALAPGERAYLTSSNALQQGVAFNPLTGRVLLVSRLPAGGLVIPTLDGNSGAESATLSTSGVSGGTLALNKIRVADDGVIYGFNTTTYNLLSPFKVYRWSGEAASPTLAYSGDPGRGNTQTWGGSLDVRGTGENTQMLLDCGGSIVSFLQTANGTTFTATALTTDAPAGAFAAGIVFGPGTRFWGKDTNGPLREMQINLAARTATTIRSLTNAPLTSLGAIEFDRVTGLLAGINPGTHEVALFDAFHASSPPVFLGCLPLPSASPNPTAQGALDFYPGGRLFVLESNNGLAAFDLVPPTRLRAGLSSSAVVLSWPQRFSNAVLQITSPLNDAWRQLVVTPQPSNGVWQVNAIRSGPGSYFRLKRTVRVMSWNIQHGEGLDATINLERIASVIRDAGPDIVGFQEVDRNTDRSGNVDQIAQLAALTGMNFFFGKNINYQNGAYGLAVLSRFPIRRQSHALLQKLNSTVEQRGVNQLEIDLGGPALVLFNTHLDAGSDEAERLSSIAQLKALSQPYTNQSLIMLGDFNARPTSSSYGAVAESFADAWPLAGSGNGYTFPANLPDRRIDYQWVRSANGLRPVRAWVISTPASDHLPVMVEWAVPER